MFGYSTKRLLSNKKLAKLMEEDSKNIEWLYKNYAKLSQMYPDSYVAIRQQKVIDSDRDVRSLLARLERRFGKIEDILVYYISSSKRKFLFYSPLILVRYFS